MQIYDSNDTLLLEVEVDDNSCRNRAIMGNDTLTLYFSLAEHTEIPIGAYCEYQGSRYTLERPENLKMHHTRLFEYVVTMEAYQSRAKHWKFKNTVDGRLKFPLTAKPHEHLQMFVDNMNLRDNGWTMGECVQGVEHLISYDHNYCIDALQMMANEFDTEWEIINKRVSLKKMEYNKATPLALAYGKGHGFKPGVGRSNSSDQMPVEILYVQGGDRNIDPSSYGFKELRLPKAGSSLGFDGTHFEDETGYDSTVARHYEVRNDRISIQRSDKPLDTYAEDSIDCSDIYPKRIGQVGSVIVVNSENHFYDIIDSETLMVDGVLQPNPCPNYSQCLIEGEKMTIIFQSGMLAGREFDAAYHDTDKRFEIVPCELDGRTMPDSVFAPVAWDTFIVFNCSLPMTYIEDDQTKSGASWDMFRASIRYLYENEDQKFTFTGDLDGIWSKSRWEVVGPKILLGGYVSFQDDRFQSDAVLVRITAIKDYINNPYSPEITLSNQVTAAGFASNMNIIHNQEVEMGVLYNDSINFTKRRFRDAYDTMLMLQEALLEEFSEGINPITLQTMQVLLGSEALQFVFVDGSGNELQSSSIFHMNNTTKVFSITNPSTSTPPDDLVLLHSDMSNIIHSEQTQMKWVMSDFTPVVLTDDTQGYYLYAKCSSTEDVETGEFVLSNTAIEMRAETGYYHFLVGILCKVYDGERSFVTVYGFTEILPGRITTDRIVSADGQTYFNLTGGGYLRAMKAEIWGTFRSPFQDGTSGQTIDDYDNIYFSNSVGYVQLDWGVEQSGRKICVAGKGMIMRPPTGKYVYCDGVAIGNPFWFDNEILTMVGYGDDNDFYGWIITNRTQIHSIDSTMGFYGSELKCVAMGTFERVDNNTYWFSGVSFDGSNINVDRLSVGNYRIRIPGSWFRSSQSFLDQYFFALATSTSVGKHVALTNKTYDSNKDECWIDFIVSQNANAIDGYFNFAFFNLAQVMKIMP